MNHTGSLFTQILSLFQRSDFERHVRQLKSEHRSKGFSSWDQFVAMLFCQLAQARSLREISTTVQNRIFKLPQDYNLSSKSAYLRKKAAQFVLDSILKPA